MELLSQTWKTPHVCRFADVENHRLQMWLRRQLLVAEHIAGGGSQGRHRSFNFRNIVEFALARALIDAGASVDAAFAAAASFAYKTTRTMTCTGYIVQREAAFPFDPRHDETFILADGGKPEIVKASELPHMFASRDGAVIVNASRIWRGVLERMGLDPAEILDEAYKTPRVIPAAE